MPCTVVERNREDLYRVGSSSGVLQNSYRAGDLEFFKGDLVICMDGWEEAPPVSLREAACAFNKPLPSRKPGVQCTCEGDCKTKRCSGKKAGTSCGSLCHHGKPCGNAFADACVDEEDVGGGIALSDSVVAKCSGFLRRNFPEFDGFSPPSVLKVRSMTRPAIGECVQVHRLGTQHWVCSYSSASNPARVDVFDSLKLPHNLSRDLSAQLQDLYQ